MFNKDDHSIFYETEKDSHAHKYRDIAIVTAIVVVVILLLLLLIAYFGKLILSVSGIDLSCKYTIHNDAQNKPIVVTASKVIEPTRTSSGYVVSSTVPVFRTGALEELNPNDNSCFGGYKPYFSDSGLSRR